MARKPQSRKAQYRALAGIDRKALAEFQAGIRKRYTDDQILEELAASAKRLGRSPTMREFAADPQTSVHPKRSSSTSAAGTRRSARPAWCPGASPPAMSCSTC